MARKKKTKKVTTQDTSSYKGSVTIKVMHGNRVVKTLKGNNAGKQPLFEFLMHCLAGSFNSVEIPRFLRVFNENDEEITTTSIISNSFPEYSSSATEGSVTISFVVPSSLLSTNTGIKILKLYSQEHSLNSDITSPSAEITLDDALTVSDNVNLLVAWKLTVKNTNE